MIGVLSYLPYNETVVIYKQGEIDSWGIKSPSTSIELPCYIREVRNSERLENVGGSVQSLTYTVVFEGRADVKIGDYLEVDGDKFKVRNVRLIKDLDRNVISTKVAV